jgi:hypothetical protein
MDANERIEYYRRLRLRERRQAYVRKAAGWSNFPGGVGIHHRSRKPAPPVDNSVEATNRRSIMKGD